LEEADDVGLLGGVGGERLDVAAASADLGGDGLEAVGAAPDDDHLKAFARKAARECRAKALRRAHSYNDCRTLNRHVAT
ncbi:hypothetical protein MXD81_20375, partial [Microbacteriaceae bacterium K1510]|nr:hypothetical protein [Microbacteriaceae bacterium K1510]